MAEDRVQLVINGQAVEARPGATILEAAVAAGTRLPMLCYSRKLPVAEACRLCVVEVAGQPRPVAACSTPVAEGMVVASETPQLSQARRAVLGLVFKDHYGDCLPPCNQRCPTNIDIQGYIALIARGQYLEAARLIRQTNPLPLTCGRVCPHPCESQCRRGRVDQPININHLKRFASDIAYRDLDALNPPRAAATGKRVAIVGGGPAGLTAAYYLALKGHEPVIHEAMPLLGGMLRYGIPEYRLPKAVLEREIEAILRLGVPTRLGQVWGRDFMLADLLADGYDAVFLGVGAWQNRRLELDGEDAAGIWPGTVFLTQVALGEAVDLGRRVAVVGGGNTAMDCARTALRLGAESVTIYYRRSRKEMPAQAIEIEEAIREGVDLLACTAPVGLTIADGRLAAMRYVGMELCELDASGRAAPKPIAGSEQEAALDSILVAIGQQVDPALLARDPLAAELKLTRGKSVEAKYQTGQTSHGRVFAAGDLVSGPATVVEAIGGARRAAEAMDRWLRGRPPEPRRSFVFSKGTLQEVHQSNFDGRPFMARQNMPELEPNERRRNFREVELGLGEEQARAEALRCLSCGCLAQGDCRLRQVAEQIGWRDLVVQGEPPRPYRVLDDHPHILIDDNKCVVCRTCERACADYHGRLAVSVSLAPFGQPQEFRDHATRINERCDSCGLCVELCPTGALSAKPAWPKPGPFPLAWSPAVCNLCPLGCRLRLGSIGDHPTAVAAAQAAPNHGHLCRRGRFELADLPHDPRRVTQPLLRRGGTLEPVAWDAALAAAAAGLAAIRDRDGGESLALLSFGRGSDEELYALAKLARLGLASNAVDLIDPVRPGSTGGRLLAESGDLPLPDYAGIPEQDLVVLVGPDLDRGLRLLEPALHRLRARGGRVLLMAPAGDALSGRADLHLALEPEAALECLTDLLMDRSAPEEAADLLAGSGSALILVAQWALATEARATWLGCLSAVANYRERRLSLSVAPSLPNSACAGRVGLGPQVLPGRRQPDAVARQNLGGVWGRPLPAGLGRFAPQILAGLEEGSIRGLVLHAGLHPEEAAADPRLTQALGRAEFKVVLACFPEPACAEADVVLPWPMGVETAGVFTSGAGAGVAVETALRLRPGLRPGWRVAAGLLRRLGGPAPAADLAALRREMAAAQGGGHAG